MITMWVAKRWTVLGSRNRHGATFTCIGHTDTNSITKTRVF